MLFTFGTGSNLEASNMAPAATSASSSSSSDESDSFEGFHMNCRPYSFKPNELKICEDTDVDSVSDEIPGDETNTAESPKNTASQTDFPTPPNQHSAAASIVCIVI